MLTFQLLAAALPSSNLALCVAADGHTAVELAHSEPGCLTDYRLHHPDEAAAHDIDRHGCIDIALSQPPFCSSSSSAATDHLGSWLAARPGFLSCPAVSFAADHRRAASLPPDSRLEARQTIVLVV